jgi:hypothetical protein
VSADPGVRDPQCVLPHFDSVTCGPVSFDLIIVDYDIAGDLNRQLFNRLRLELHAFRRVHRDPIGDVILPQGR